MYIAGKRSGIILQWGASIADGNTETLPIAFPNAFVHLSGSYVGAGMNDANTTSVEFLRVSNSQFRCNLAQFSQNSSQVFVNTTTANGVTWLAIGY